MRNDFFWRLYNIGSIFTFLLTELKNPNISETKFVTMKHLAPYALLLLLTLSATTVFSQTSGAPKPKQFDNYPDVINCSESELSKVFTSAAGSNIDFSFSNSFLFSGAVTSNVVKYSNLQSAVVRSPLFNNTIFSISKIINSDNTITYVGHIINKNYFDGYELKKNAVGNYQLIKIETDKVIPDCKQN